MSCNERIHVVDPSAFPFVKVDLSVVDDPELSIYDTAVYMALCSFANNTTGAAYPSVATLAKRAKCSERQARESIRKLEARGYIVTTSQNRQNGRCNLYTLTHKRSAPSEPAAGVGSAHGAEGSAHGAAELDLMN